ncbi:MAG: mannitol dehydrogenase family protein, partial [Clostridia bacterium]|nr:mannitol dehydrogenase family protein [Clostridia bacterium]
MKLCLDALKEKKAWLDAGFTLPGFDVEEMAQKTKAAPVWLHLGAGNIFRAFPAADLQLLLDKGLCDKGVIVAECFDGEIIDKAYRPFDSLSVLCVLKSDGTVDKKVIASVCEALRCDGKNEADDQRLMEVLSAPSLQMVSLTITEKGYAVKNAKGDIFPFIQTDIENGPGKAASTMGKLTAGLYRRFKAGKLPVSLVSMDNCSGNGDKLKAAVLCIAMGWAQNDLVDASFLTYLQDETKVAFPISMIDKIT